MKVKELKELLSSLPDEMEVILQKDSEGNGYSPLHDGDSNAVYVPSCTWEGDVYFMDWSAEDACMDEELWEETKTMPRALILSPVN